MYTVLSQSRTEVEDSQGLRVSMGGNRAARAFQSASSLVTCFQDWIISLFIEWILMFTVHYGRSACRDAFTEATAAALGTSGSGS